MTINLKQSLQLRIRTLLDEYKLFLKPNEKMDESNLKFVQQYINSAMKKGDTIDAIEFLEDAIDIAYNLQMARFYYERKFGV